MKCIRTLLSCGWLTLQPSQAGWRKKKINSATGANTDVKASRELLPTRGPPYSHTQLKRTARHLRRDTRQESSGWLYSLSQGASQASTVLPCDVSVGSHRLRFLFFLVCVTLSPSNSTNFVHTISAFCDPNRDILVIQIYMGKRVAWEASASSLYSRGRKRAAPTDKRRPSRYWETIRSSSPPPGCSALSPGTSSAFVLSNSWRLSL